MKHHSSNRDFRFVLPPQEFDKFAPRHQLQYCLGATLYMPGTRQIADKIIHHQLPDLTSMVMCFEDAIHEADLERAESNVLRHLTDLAEAVNHSTLSVSDIPLTFIRVRNVDQFYNFTLKLDPQQASILSGFVFPKFYSYNADKYLEILLETSNRLNSNLYGMPILEGTTIAFCETRIEELVKLKKTLDPAKEHILNIRVGGTDFSALFGVRRDINSSIYDIIVVRDCLADILNIFNRDPDYTVSAPVWEYFLAYNKDDIASLLRQSLHRSLLNRNPILNDAIDGLLREVIQDKSNGFTGKTVIHPSHLRFVNAIQAVTKEEYDDAVQILGHNGGVIKSAKANKMNEINPHRSWANKLHARAQAYGVVEDDSSFLQLIGKIR